MQCIQPHWEINLDLKIYYCLYYSNIRHLRQLNCWSLRCSWSISYQPTTSSFSTSNSYMSRLNTWLQWIGQRQLQDETRNIEVLGFGEPYINSRDLMVPSAVEPIITYGPLWVIELIRPKIFSNNLLYTWCNMPEVGWYKPDAANIGPASGIFQHISHVHRKIPMYLYNIHNSSCRNKFRNICAWDIGKWCCHTTPKHLDSSLCPEWHLPVQPDKLSSVTIAGMMSAGYL